jgi:hypothetical protein
MQSQAIVVKGGLLWQRVAFWTIFACTGMLCREAGAKPVPPIDLSISAPSDGLSVGDTTTVTLSITPKVDIERVQVRFEASSSNVALTGASPIEVGAVFSGKTYFASTEILLSGTGKTEVRGWAYAFDARGTMLFGRSVALCIVASEKRVLVGDTSFIELEIGEAQQQLASKNLSEAQYAARIQSLISSTGHNTTKTAQGKSGAKGFFYVSGSLQWTDGAGTTHYLRGPAKVEIWEHNAGGDVKISETATSGGFYYSQVENIDPEGGLRDLFVRIYTENNYLRVYNPTTGDTYFLQSDTTNDVADDANLTKDFVANNTDTPDRGFSVLDGTQVAVENAGLRLGGYLAKIDVDFPTSESTSNFSGGQLHILMDDWIDWDVLDHEWGHYFMDEKNIESNPGGDHNLDENLSERVGKTDGIHLAWGEGFPTFFGTASQNEFFLSTLNIPNVGDTYYTDTIDSTNNYDLETKTGVGSFGEDNEVSVQRILWDLYDNPQDGEDKVALGQLAVFQAASSVGATSISEFWNGLIAAKAATMKQKVAYGCIFGDHEVASELTAPDDGDELGGAIPTFRWDANAGGPSFLADKFKVQFWKDNLSSMIFESPELNAAEFTPTNDQWMTIASDDGAVRWVVLSRQTDAPETGEYVSCSRRVGKGDIAFVIDDTGSMGEEIGGVRDALTTYISVFQALDLNPTIHLVTFKDGVTSVIMSNDLDAVQTEVSALSAGGGDDCPEASVEALLFTEPTLKPGGTILLATDADAHFGLDIGAAIAILRANGTRVNVLLSGSCNEIFKSRDGVPLLPSQNCDTCDLNAKLDYPTAAIALYTTLAAETGGFYAFVPEINTFDPSGAQRYENTGVNVLRGFTFPAIAFASPGFGNRGTTLSVLVSGSNTNFNETSTISFGGTGITVNSGQANSPTSFTANLTVAADAELGFRDVTITSDLGGKANTEEATGIGSFEVKDVLVAPTILAVDPAQGIQGQTMDIQIFGGNTHFANDSTVTVNGVFFPDVTVNSVSVQSETLLTANITIPEDTGVGYRNVVVNTASVPESAGEAIAGPFLVISPAASGFPLLLAIDPDSTIRNRIVNVNVVGANTNFANGVSVGSVSGDGVSVSSTAVQDLTHATLTISVEAGATLGFRDIFVTTGDEVAAILDAFEISGATIIADAGPDQTINSNGSVNVQLDGSASTSTAAPIVAYHWSGTPDPDDVVGPTVNVSEGEHVFTLVVEDQNGTMSDADTVTITIENSTDIDSSGTVDAVDVQLVINGALNIDTGGLNTDIDGDSDVDAVDVQLVINAALA